MLQKGRNVLWCVKEQRWFEKKNHIFIKRDVYYNQHLNPVEHHYLLYIIHHPVLNWEKKVSSVNKCKSQRLFFIWAFMWGVLCSPNHNSLNFYGILKGQPKIPHFLSSNFIFLRWKHLPMYRKQTLEQCYSIFLFMAYFYFMAGVTMFKEKLDCRMDVVFFKSDWYNVWKLLNTYYSWNCIEIKKL